MVLVPVQPTSLPRAFISAQIGMFFLSRPNCIESPLVSYWGSNYPIGAAGGYLFSVADGDVRGGVVPITNRIPSQKYGCWVYNDDFVSSQSRLSSISL